MVFHFDLPQPSWVASLKSAGIPIWAQVPSVDQARAALAAGLDGLVVQGKEAGGHNRSTTPLHHLLADVRRAVGDHVLMLASGGIATGADVAAAMAHGADGVWVGTRLVASTEAYAHPKWKRRIVRADSREDTVITKLYGPELPCQPYHVLRNPVVDASIGQQDELCALPAAGQIGTTVLFPGTSIETTVPMPNFSALPPTQDTTGDFDAMGMPAGDGVRNIHDIKPAARIVADMMAEARSILAGRRA